MDQDELDREVARATGESIETIQGMGFSLLVAPPPLVVVDHRARLGDLTRQKMRQRMKSREAPPAKPGGNSVRPAVRKMKPLVTCIPSMGTGAGGGGMGRARAAARAPEWREWITPLPQFRTLTFDKWRA